MTAQKHTAGPWNSFNEFGNRGGCFGADGVTLIAHLPRSLPNDRHRTPSALEADANFRLIDASTELLEVCRNLASDLRAEIEARYPSDTFDSYPSQRSRFERDIEVVKHAECLISRIEGRSNG